MNAIKNHKNPPWKPLENGWKGFTLTRAWPNCYIIHCLYLLVMFLYFFLYVEIIISSPGFLCSVSSHSVYNSYIRYLWLNDLWGFTLGRNHFVAVSVTMLSQNIVFMQSIWEHTLGRCHITSINVTRFFRSHVI